jgi:hypothetical protein
VLWFLPDDSPAIATLTAILRETERQGRALGVELRLLKVTHVEDLTAAMVALDPRRDGGVIVLPTVLAFGHAKTVADLAQKQKLPSIGDPSNFVESGGLMAYGADYYAQVRGAATYVDRILRGARPADLPVQQPSKFQLIINLNTAKALGLTVPTSLLVRADQVIEQLCTTTNGAGCSIRIGEDHDTPEGRTRTAASRLAYRSGRMGSRDKVRRGAYRVRSNSSSARCALEEGHRPSVAIRRRPLWWAN